jgi:hypothetical protein
MGDADGSPRSRNWFECNELRAEIDAAVHCATAREWSGHAAGKTPGPGSKR